MPKKITKKLLYERLHELLKYNPETGEWVRKLYVNSNSQAGCVAGCIAPDGYRRIAIDGKRYKASRLAFLYMEGYFPEHEVDHINRVRHDDRWINLREATRRCNMKNCSVRKNSKSGITGVCWDKINNKWRVRIIDLDEKEDFVGRFKSKREAVQKRWEAEKKYNYPNCNSTSSAYLYLQNNR